MIGSVHKAANSLALKKKLQEKNENTLGRLYELGANISNKVSFKIIFHYNFHPVNYTE